MGLYQIQRPILYGGVFYLIMAYVITDTSVQCGSCKDECPLELISEANGKYVINAEECVECGTCADICPNDAIHVD